MFIITLQLSNIIYDPSSLSQCTKSSNKSLSTPNESQPKHNESEELTSSLEATTNQNKVSSDGYVPWKSVCNDHKYIPMFPKLCETSQKVSFNKRSAILPSTANHAENRHTQEVDQVCEIVFKIFALFTNVLLIIYFQSSYIIYEPPASSQSSKSLSKFLTTTPSKSQPERNEPDEYELTSFEATTSHRTHKLPSNGSKSANNDHHYIPMCTKPRNLSANRQPAILPQTAQHDNKTIVVSSTNYLSSVSSKLNTQSTNYVSH